MNNLSPLSELPSTANLIKTTLISTVVAGALLFTTVLPAEYGVDPTGIGQALGLTQLSSPQADEVQVVVTEPAQGLMSDETVVKYTATLRTDSLSLPLMPGPGAELKSVMKEGDHMVFNWSTDKGVVSFDMHGDRPNSGGAITSYWLGDDQASSNGLFTEPFDGYHGWYWENR